MDWFIYDNGLRHETVKQYCTRLTIAYNHDHKSIFFYLNFILLPHEVGYKKRIEYNDGTEEAHLMWRRRTRLLVDCDEVRYTKRIEYNDGTEEAHLMWRRRTRLLVDCDYFFTEKN